MMKNRMTAPAKPMTTKAPAEQVVKDNARCGPERVGCQVQPLQRRSRIVYLR